MLRPSWMAVAGLFVTLALTVRVKEHRLDREQSRVRALALQAVKRGCGAGQRAERDGECSHGAGKR